MIYIFPTFSSLWCQSTWVRPRCKESRRPGQMCQSPGKSGMACSTLVECWSYICVFLFWMSLIFISRMRWLSPRLTVLWSFLPGSLMCQKASSGSTLHFCPKCRWPFSSTVRPKPKTSWRNFSTRTGECAKLKVPFEDALPRWAAAPLPLWLLNNAALALDLTKRL